MFEEAANQLGSFSCGGVIELEADFRAVFFAKEKKTLAVVGKGELRALWGDEFWDVVAGKHDFAGRVEIGDGDGRFEIDGGWGRFLLVGIVVVEILLLKFGELVGGNFGATFEQADLRVIDGDAECVFGVGSAVGASFADEMDGDSGLSL